MIIYLALFWACDNTWPYNPGATIEIQSNYVGVSVACELGLKELFHVFPTWKAIAVATV